MLKKTLAGVAAVVTLAAGTFVIAGEAGASPVAAARKVFSAKATPMAPHPGQKVVVKGTKSLPNQGYGCVLITYLKKNPTTVGQYLASTVMGTSDAKGNISCTVTYTPFSTSVADASGKSKGTHSCPSTAADKKAGYACGIAVFDVGIGGKGPGETSAALVPLNPKKK